MKKTPKQKTSIYIDKEHLQTIQEMKDKYNLSVNRTINLCLKNYLPEIQEGNVSSGSDAMSEELTEDQWTVHDIDELKQKFSDWLDDTVDRLGGERKVRSRVEKEGKLHFRIHDMILSDPNDKEDAQDFYVTIEPVESVLEDEV